MHVRDKIKEVLFRVTGSEDVKLDTPSNSDNGDWATSVALEEAKRLNKTPHELAKDIVSKLEEDNELKKVIGKIEVAGPGFINFWVSDEALLEQVARPAEVQLEAGRKAVVEYSSPNIAKPFGIGHFRSTVIGDAVANLLEADGWKVYRDNHLGDWGTQFGKLIYKIKLLASNKNASTESLNLTIKELVDLYVEFHEEAEKDPGLEDRGREEFKKLEDGDEENRKIWQYCVDISLKEFNKVYELLGIKFTENDGLGYGESYFESLMAPVISEMEEKGLLKVGEDGAKLVFFENDKFPPLMIVKKDGSTLYVTRDLAADKFRLGKHGQEVEIINEVGADQNLYFQQLFEVEKILGWVKDGQRVHVKHGMFRFKDRKMSTRKGDIIWLDDVIAEAIARARKFGSDDELAKRVAIGALKWNDLKRNPVSDIVFDWDEILNMEGNSGPYIQYTYARASSILSKAGSQVPEKITISKGSGTEDVMLDEKEKSVARVLIHYPEILKDAAKFYSPHILANYLYVLAKEFNSFYNSDRIIGSNRETPRLLLTKAVGQIIKNGLALLGIVAPEKM